MSFASLDFIIFILLFFIAWPHLKKHRQSRWAYLTLASFVFYGWWDWRFLFLIVISGLIDFCAALAIRRWYRYRKAWLLASLGGNLGILFAFKYLDFILTSLQSLATYLGLPIHIGTVGWILPVGISFYTFQSMSYTIDVYQGRLRPTRNLLHFFAYLSMFPQLVAGPIVRARDILDQLREQPRTSEAIRFDGFQLIVMGYFKKVVIADNIAPIVNSAFNATHRAECLFWWTMILLFAIQIYCDFSGYSDIAMGLALWMGYQFKPNFNHPYISGSFSEFWTRWHISLSSWFRDYVYIPLGGNRHGTWQTHRNLWIAMLLSGLWHGAAWNYVIWGGMHAALLSFEKVTHWPERLKKLPGGTTLSIILVFATTLITWVCFRAQSFEQCLAILKSMFAFNTIEHWNITYYTTRRSLVLTVLLLARHAWFLPVAVSGRQRLPELNLGGLAWSGRLAWTSFILFTCIILRGPGSAFIYFQF